jgi:hypothetical protein
MSQLYRYPAGVVIDGQPLAAPAVLPPCRVVIAGLLHGPEICDLWTTAELAAIGVKPVTVDALPADTHGWPYLSGAPVDVDEGATIRRTYPNATPDEAGWTAHVAVLAAQVRAERDARLTACDWTQLPDSPLTAAVKAAWATYRQALRDVPEQAGFPSAVEWPVEPA